MATTGRSARVGNHRQECQSQQPPAGVPESATTGRSARVGNHRQECQSWQPPAGVPEWATTGRSARVGNHRQECQSWQPPAVVLESACSDHFSGMHNVATNFQVTNQLPTKHNMVCFLNTLIQVVNFKKVMSKVNFVK